MSDVARNQVEMFESKAEIENIEIEALRHQVIDLQTQTDEKVSFFRKHWLICQYFSQLKIYTPTIHCLVIGFRP